MLFFRIWQRESLLCREEKNKTFIVQLKLYPELLLSFRLKLALLDCHGQRTYMCILSGICHLIVSKSQLYTRSIYNHPPCTAHREV